MGCTAFSSERLGFGMALCLVVVAQQIVTAQLIVVSNERLWLDKLVGWSFYWVLFTMIESAVIGFLYYIREDRVAKKENKRISMMNLSARRAMMAGEDGCVDGNKKEGADECLPLTLQNDDALSSNEAIASLDGPGQEGVGNSSERTVRFDASILDTTTAKKPRSRSPYSYLRCLRSISLRKFDYG